ncbi:MAG: FixH family protein [Gammaproteobacteria bacterium]|nr:FixH family protein [Gammaproteobacteria bacterium]
MKKHIDGIHTYLLTLLAIGSLLAHAPAYSGDTKQFVDGAHFRLYYKSTTTPVPLNEIHTWLLHLYTRDGEPVDGAHFRVYGGMPAHRHGLPTQPRVSGFGDGHYWLQGLKFSMQGEWEVWFDIEAAGKTDRVMVELEL